MLKCKKCKKKVEEWEICIITSEFCICDKCHTKFLVFKDTKEDLLLEEFLNEK